MRADGKKAQVCDKKYQEAVDGCRALQDIFYDKEMPRILAVKTNIFIYYLYKILNIFFFLNRNIKE